MIYNSTIKAVNESEFDTLLENAEDRFEFSTMLEATSIIVAEQEENWTRFMRGIGLSELNTVMEGQEVIYEGARLKGFIEKAKGFFKAALNKLAEITKRFIAKVMQIIPGNDAFVKKYEKDLKDAKIPSDFSFKGYEFSKKLDETPKYEVNTAIGTGASYEKEDAEAKFVSAGEDSFAERVRVLLYGSKEKKELKSANIADQISILKTTKDLKDKARKSYTEASKKIKDIIKTLEKAQKEVLKDDNKSDLSTANNQYKDIDKLVSYWKAYASCSMTYHGTFMAALSSRNSQAKAICVKVLNDAQKVKGKAARLEIKKKAGIKTEGYVNTDAFLGAVEFI